ncbi:hypothetical protein FOL47_006463, partial [Perkinsus chesapeaki]
TVVGFIAVSLGDPLTPREKTAIKKHMTVSPSRIVPIRPHPSNKTKFNYILNVEVDAAYQRKGIALRCPFVGDVLALALDVLKSNKPAIALYKKLNFIDVMGELR